MAIKNYKDKIEELILPILVEIGFDLFELNFTNEFDSNILQILVTNSNGQSIIDFDNLVKANEKIAEIIDLNIKDDESYILEVSSAGAERKIRNQSELLNSKDKYLFIEMNKQIENFKDFYGTLVEIINEIFIFNVNIKGRIKKISLKWDEIKFVRNAIKF